MMKVKPMNDLSVTMELKLSPKLHKELIALGFDYARPSGIERKRRRLLRKARALDKGSYERTQYHWPYGKVRRNATKYSRRTYKRVD